VSREDLDAIRASLADSVERLDEIALEELREAVARGDSTRPALERRLTRARNAILRALAVLHEEEQTDL
jgi:hypothetical protein